MKKMALLVFFVLLGLALGVGWWFSSSDYRQAQARMMEAPKITAVYPIQIWAYGSAGTIAQYQQTVDELRGVFPNKLTLKSFPDRETYLKNVREAFRKGSSPDVFMGEIQDLVLFYAEQKSKPIPLKDVSNFEWLSEVYDTFTRGTNLVAYPAEYAVQVLYYNRYHFDRVGVAYADTHWTWDDLLSIARALYRPSGSDQSTVYGLEYRPSFELWNALAVADGNGIYKGSQWQWGSSSSSVSIFNSLQLLIDLHKVYAFCAPVTNAETPQEFLEGNAALAIAGPSLRQALMKLDKDHELQWGATLLPRKNNVATPLTARGWTSSAYSRSPENALSIAHALSMVVTEGWLSARPSKLANTTNQDYSTVFQISLRYAQPPFMHPRYQEVKGIVERKLQYLDQPGELDAHMIIADMENQFLPLDLKTPWPPRTP